MPAVESSQLRPAYLYFPACTLNPVVEPALTLSLKAFVPYDQDEQHQKTDEEVDVCNNNSCGRYNACDTEKHGAGVGLWRSDEILLQAKWWPRLGIQCWYSSLPGRDDLFSWRRLVAASARKRREGRRPPCLASAPPYCPPNARRSNRRPAV
jgi:hypothetical protein